MSKKIIIVAVLMLALVVLFAACKKNDYTVDYTVKLENGDVIEVYEDENGENFITNVDGDEIPVTTDKDGFYDDITSLVTQTTTKANKDNDKTTTTTTKPSTTTTTTTQKSDESASDSTTTTTEKSSIEVGKGNHDGHVSWDDINRAD